MRITSRMMTETVIGNLMNNLDRTETLERQLTSGKRISRPSDDGPGVARALTYRSGIAAGEQYLRNMDNATAWLDATDNSLGSVTQALQRARELAVQGGNGGSLSAQDQQALAAEVNSILEHVVDLGNSSLRGERLFAGAKIDANPFALNPGPPTTVANNGDNAALLREIDTGVTVQINVPSSAVFPAVFNALINLRDNLQAGNTAAVTGTDIAAIDSALDTVMNTRATVGSTVNRVEAAQERQTGVQQRLMELRSNTEDTDFTEAMSSFSLQETLYRASLQAGARAIQPSLLDYLR